jgi:hypothetical protein
MINFNRFGFCPPIDKAAKRFGRPFDIQNPPRSLNENAAKLRFNLLRPIPGNLLIESCQPIRRNALGHVLKVEVAVVENPTVNAAVLLQGDTHCVCIFSGLLLSAFRIANLLLINPNWLPDIGNIDLMLRGPDRFFFDNHTAFFTKKIDFGDNVDDEETLLIHNGIIPSCPTRAQAAHFLYESLIWLTIRHELFHAILGHCLFNKKVFGMKELLEIQKSKSLPHAFINIQQLLEYEADLSSFIFTAQILFDPSSPIAQAYPVDEEPLRARLFVAACRIFHIWIAGALPFDQSIPDLTTSHPHFRSRAALLIHMAKQTCATMPALASAFEKSVDFDSLVKIYDQRFAGALFHEIPFLFDEQVQLSQETAAANSKVLSQLHLFRFAQPEFGTSYDGNPATLSDE